MKPILSRRSTRSASSSSFPELTGSCVVANENALMKTLACCSAVKSWRRLLGSSALSFTRVWSRCREQHYAGDDGSATDSALEPSRSSLPRQQERRANEPGDDAEEV